MKKLIALIALTFAVTLATINSNASVVTLTQSSNYSYGNGGAFIANTYGGNPGPAYATTATTIGGFLTFCVEQTVEFNPGVQYNYTVSNKDSQGNPLSLATAYLYSQFASGTLNGYDYSAVNRSVEDGELQAAIWYFQSQPNLHENGLWGNVGNIFYTLAESITGANSFAANNGTYNVGIMQLTDNNGAAHQNQLILVPSSAVPEPSTIMAGMLLLLPLGCAVARTYGKKKQSIL